MIVQMTKSTTVAEIMLHLEVGDDVSGLKLKYPLHGKRNILCDLEGNVEKVGRGPNGWFVTVKKPNGHFRSYSEKKLVRF